MPNRRKRCSPLEEAGKWLLKREDPPGFEVADYGHKGRGVKTVMTREKGQFLLQYAGEKLSGEEGERRESEKSSGYRFFFSVQGKHKCVDATAEDGRLGRLVNHGGRKEINSSMKAVKGCLVLFANRDIVENEEILYDYGIENLPWQQGFFKLFTTFKIAASIDDTSVLVVPASSNGHTKNSTIKVFKCLLGRKNVVSYNWIKDSIRLGKVQDIDHYLVKSVSDYGEVRKTEGFEKFEFQIRGKKWNDIKEEDIRDMLLKIGGIETMNIGPETIILCADDEIHTSDQCVGKEWLFTCIVEGVVKPIPRQVVSYCSDSEEERSAVIELDPFPFSKRIRVQLSKSSFKNSRSQKFQACVYCGKLDKKISRHMINKHSEEQTNIRRNTRLQS